MVLSSAASNFLRGHDSRLEYSNARFAANIIPLAHCARWINCSRMLGASYLRGARTGSDVLDPWCLCPQSTCPYDEYSRMATGSHFVNGGAARCCHACTTLGHRARDATLLRIFSFFFFFLRDSPSSEWTERRISRPFVKITDPAAACGQLQTVSWPIRWRILSVHGKLTRMQILRS